MIFFFVKLQYNLGLVFRTTKIGDHVATGKELGSPILK